MSQPPHSAARRLVETLVMNGVDRVFCVPGESYLAVLDALADVAGSGPGRIQVITCRHEAGAANMAEAYGKLTGKPGVCMVTRGPGATHAAIGVHTAHQDSTPMILFVGQIALSDRGRGAFQEVDYREVFGGLAKWATELEQADRTVELVERAFATALQGRMGPVVMALPEDLLHADGGPAPLRPVTPARAALDPARTRARHVGEGVEHGQIAFARHAEDAVDAVHDQGFDQAAGGGVWRLGHGHDLADRSRSWPCNPQTGSALSQLHHWSVSYAQDPDPDPRRRRPGRVGLQHHLGRRSRRLGRRQGRDLGRRDRQELGLDR